MSENPQPQTEEVVPLNLKAILDWCEEFRPDLRPIIWAERANNGFILLATTGFEAGSKFQKDHPDFPMGGEACPLYLNQAVVMQDGQVMVSPEPKPET
jgi:hypothetical protein